MPALTKLRRAGAVATAGLLISQFASALPIGFGHTQGDSNYDLTETKNFRIYHDSRTPNEARSVASALEAAKPVLENWLQIKRRRPLPVIMSARAAGASFANNITDAVELQTLGQGGRDLYWHEFVHSSMYRHYDNFLGPAGSVLHLIWMPTWFIEGLPEALTVSSGSHVQAAFERYHALSQEWPSYERLHSLYGVGSFATEGYATSGAFVAYIFRKYGAEKLPELLRNFYENSKLWWWPWAALPFSPYLPFDDALATMTGKKGPELYEEYKKAANIYWRDNSRGPFISGRKGANKSRFSPGVRIWSHGPDLHYIASMDNGDKHLMKAVFDKESGWAYGKKASRFPPDAGTTTIMDPDLSIFTQNALYDGRRIKGESIAVMDSDYDLHDIVEVEGYISSLFKTRTKIAWVQRTGEAAKLCVLPRSLLNKKQKLPANAVRCPIKIKQPKLLTILGQKDVPEKQGKGYVADEIWLATSEQTLKGDRHRIYSWNPESNSPITAITPPILETPINIGFAGNDIWLLAGERKQYVLRKIDKRGNCQGMIDVADVVQQMWGLPNGSLALRLRAGNNTFLHAIPKEDLHPKPCRQASSHISPLLVAMRQGKKTKISNAISTASLWASTEESRASSPKTIKAPALGKEKSLKSGESKIQKTSPAPFRGRPISALPWVGADNSGLTLGFLSSPFMDEMQNETIMFNALWGINSTYPDTRITLTTTRFSPVLSWEAFRTLTWEGLGQRNGKRFSAYADESGSTFRLANSWAWAKLTYSLEMKNSMVRPLDAGIRRGRLNEVSTSLSRRFDLGIWNLGTSLDFAAAHKSLNEAFDYSKLGLNFSFTRGFELLDSKLSVGLKGSQTQGPKTRNLREAYQPLKTFIPGSGGGTNGNSFNLIDNENISLFSSRYGDTQGRFSLNYSFPLIAEFNQLIRIVYLRSLEFSSFFNYGGAWNVHDVDNGGVLSCQTPKSAMGNPKGYECNRLIPAVGANVDLLLDIKGVNLNLSMGSGKVLGEPFALYFKFGFDSILAL